MLLARKSLVKSDRNLKQQFIPNVTCLLMLMLTNDPPASKSSPVRLEPFSARGLWTCKVRRQQGGQSHQCLKKMSSLSSATSSFTSFAFDLYQNHLHLFHPPEPITHSLFLPSFNYPPSACFARSLAITTTFHIIRWSSKRTNVYQISSQDFRKSKLKHFFQCDVETATGVYSCLSLDMQVMQSLFRTYFRNRFQNIS